MITSDPRTREFHLFTRTLEWTIAEATRMLHEEGQVTPQMYFVSMQRKAIGRIGHVKLLDGDVQSERHLRIMAQAIQLHRVDVAVMLQVCNEAKPGARTQTKRSVLIHLVGKSFEAMVTCPYDRAAKHLDQPMLSVEDLVLRSGSVHTH